MKHVPDEGRGPNKQLGELSERAPRSSRKQRSSPIGCRSRLWLSLLAILLLVVWIAPWLILKTPLRNSLAQRALGDFEGKISIGSATTGWLSPITLEQVQLRDADGELLLEADQVVSHRALLSLLTHLSSPGKFEVHRPSVYVVAEADALNWERAIEPWLSAPDQEAFRPSISVHVEDGRIFTRRLQETDWQSLGIPSVDFELNPAAFELALQLSNSSTAEAGTNEGPEPGHPVGGTLNLQLSQIATDETSDPQWTGELKAEQFDLDWASPLFERIERDSTLGGQLDGVATFNGTLETAEARTQLKQLLISNLALHIPSLTRDQALRLARVSLDGSLAHQASRITTQALQLDSELARFTANGALDLDLLQGLDFSFVDLPDLRVEGTIDLERLGQSLPGLVRLREGLTIERGTANLVAVSREEAGERRLFIDLNATDLHAVHEGRPISWRQPLRVSLSARGRNDAVWLEFVECDAEFLKFSGSGDARQGKLDGRADLARLRNQLTQFIDLGDLRFGGTLVASLSWAPVPNSNGNAGAPGENVADATDGIQVQSTMEIEQLQVAWNDTEGWSEPRVTLGATIDLEHPRGSTWRVLQGTGELQTQTERAQVWVRQPLEMSALSEMVLDVELSGDIGNVMKRVRPWLADSAIDAAGQFRLQGPVVLKGKRIELDHLAGGLQKVRVVAPGVQFREPEVQIDLTGMIDLEASVADLSTSTWAGSTLAFSLTRFQQSWATDSSHTEIDLAYRADAFRLVTSFAAFDEIAYRPFGEVTGNALLSQSSDLLRVSVSGESFPFTLARKGASPDGMPAQVAEYETVWTEEEISFDAKLEHRWNKDRYVIESFKLASPSVAINGQGFVARPDEDAYVDFSGEIMTDLGRISERTKFLNEQTIAFYGKSQEPFSVKGRLRDVAQGSDATPQESGLVPRTLTAAIATKFESANLVGLETGGAKVAAQLQGQVVRWEPIVLPVGQGTLNASPVIRLSGSIPVLELRDEHLLQHVSLTPEVTRSWIGYTAPILASSTKAEGTFSIDLDRASVPLTQAFAGEATGRLIIDQASLGPGPLGVQLLGLARQVRLAVTGRAGTQRIEDIAAQLPPQTIQFRLQDQRMYHDQVIIQLDDLTLVTSGSIGADQSLDMVVEIRIPQAWVAGRPIAGAIANANLKVPIQGKLAAPDIDARQLLRQLGGSLLENELRKGLRDLFGGGNE